MAPGDDWVKKYEERRRIEKQKATGKLINALASLKQLQPDLESIIFHYNGSGDSGEIYKCDQEIPSDIEDDIKNALYIFMPDGWEINEGSQGDIEVSIDGSVQVHHDWNVVSTEHEEFNFPPPELDDDSLRDMES